MAKNSTRVRFSGLFVFITIVIGQLVPEVAIAQGKDFLEDKQITMMIGSAPGGGTDTSGRLIASFFSKYLPGRQNLVVQNIPGAGGITALNYFSNQVKPDGLTVFMGAANQVDPLQYRKGQAHYDPSQIQFVGGFGRGGTFMIINTNDEKRLYDKSATPVIMGSLAGVPRSGMQMTLWGIQFLGWNAKWVVGYPGTNELMLALDRGEIGMTATGNMFDIEKLIGTGKFKVLVQSGSINNGKFVGRPEFKKVPIFSNVMQEKLNDPVAQKAFDYFLAISATDKWIGLPPKTPKTIVDIYRTAYDNLIKDPEFIERARTMSEDFTPMSHNDVRILVMTLENTSNEAFQYIQSLLSKQGFK